MGVDHVTVTFEHKSLMPRDRVVNTFCFLTAGDFVDPLEFSDIEEAIRAFYNDVHAPAGRSIASYISPSMSRTANPIIRHYDVTNDLGGTPAGSPVSEINMPNLGMNVSAGALPAEVSVCLSFNAAYGVDVEFAPGARPRARDRGRLYIGPLGLDAVDTSAAPPRAIPSAGLLDAVLQGGAFLRSNANVDWRVWSRRAASTKTVVSVSVDDAFDTQRRRGERPTAKLTA